MPRHLSVTETAETPRSKVSLGWIVPFIVLFLSLLVSGFAAYSHNDKELSNRVTAVEAVQKEQKDNTEKRLDRIENKIDRLIERGNK